MILTMCDHKVDTARNQYESSKAKYSRPHKEAINCWRNLLKEKVGKEELLYLL